MDGYIHWSPGVTLESLEQQAIQKAFKFFEGNKTQTAHALGISVRTLDAKLEKYHEQEVAQAEKDHHERDKNREFLSRARGEKTPNYQWNSGIEPKPGNPNAGPLDANEVPAKEDSRGERPLPVTPRNGVESDADSSQKPALSVPEWEEVQEVLPESDAKSSSNRSRKRA